MNKRWWLGILVVVVLVTGVGLFRMTRLSDLRTDYLKERGLKKEDQLKGRRLVLEAVSKLGGVAAWKKLKSKNVAVEFQDLWPGWLSRKLVMPQEFNGQKAVLKFSPAKENSRLEFLDGKRKGSAWGIQQWVTYKVSQQGKVNWNKDKDIKFWLPTYQYFFFMPFYLTEAQLLVFAGQKKLKGRTYNLVLATWKSLQPQKNIDQYLVWIDAKTKRITYVQYTVRDMMPSIQSQVWVRDYKPLAGLLVPRHYTVIHAPGRHKDVLHDMLLNKVSILPSLRVSYLLPDASRKGTK